MAEPQTHTLPEFLTEWVSRQRWFAGKGRAHNLVGSGSWAIPSADPDVSIRTHVLVDLADDPPTVYQVPLTRRSKPLLGADDALLGSAAHDSDHGRFVYDAPHDPAYVNALLALMTHPGEQAAALHGEALPGIPPLTALSSRVYRGEQSNTSIVCDVGEGRNPVVCKVFRTLHDGENPDVAVQAALASDGAAFIPSLIGWLTGTWTDPRQESGKASGHLAFAQEFLPGVRDAWQVALDAARAGRDFTGSARTLGETTALMHLALADTMPTAEADDEAISGVLAGMAERQRTAAAEVPELAGQAEKISAVYEAARAEEWPEFQRIHADFHLGQVLAVPERGWVILDFEGEPLRSMRERSGLDVTLRDVAGMLRSFSYVAGEIALSEAGAADSPEVQATISGATSWAAECRAAFLDGYAAIIGWDPRSRPALLGAFELDKAVYEALYERRNRPSWLPIPLTGIRRILHDTEA